MYKLLYTGKSNKKFTHNELYNFMGSPSLITEKENVGGFFNVVVYGKNNRLVTFVYNHLDYFYDNFKLANENEIKQLERKKKLNKINESTTT